MNSQAANAAAGGSPSVRARRADGDRIRSYGGSPGTALPHELGHLLAGDAFAGGDVALGLRQSCERLGVGQQLQRGLQGVQVLLGHQHDEVTSVASHVDPLVGLVDLVGDLGQPSLHFGKRERLHRPEY